MSLLFLIRFTITSNHDNSFTANKLALGLNRRVAMAIFCFLGFEESFRLTRRDVFGVFIFTTRRGVMLF